MAKIGVAIAYAFHGLVKGADMYYVHQIEFRPDDLASSRAMRRTDDPLQNLDHTEPLRSRAACLNTY
jgi:hypothetical protein